MIEIEIIWAFVTFRRPSPYNNMWRVVSVYDKRDDFAFWIVNFLHMDSNIPIYISQLVRYACFFIDFSRLSSRLNQQRSKSLSKFFQRHGVNIKKYQTTMGDETGNQRLNSLAISFIKAFTNPFNTLSVSVCCVRGRYLNMRALSFTAWLTCVVSSLINALHFFGYFPTHIPSLRSSCKWLLLKFSTIVTGFNGAESNCGIRRILGILYWRTVLDFFMF